MKKNTSGARRTSPAAHTYLDDRAGRPRLDHLKSVFGKTGVRSRRELLATFGVSQDTRATR